MRSSGAETFCPFRRFGSNTTSSVRPSSARRNSVRTMDLDLKAAVAEAELERSKQLPEPVSGERKSAAKWRDSREDENRRDMGIAKLFSMFPPPPDMEASVMAYLQETRDIPWLFVSHAIRRLIDRPVSERGSLVPRRFLPSISEIRHEAARVIREFKLRAEGKPIAEHSMRGDFELRPDRWIEQAPQVVEILQAHGLLGARDVKRIA